MRDDRRGGGAGRARRALPAPSRGRPAGREHPNRPGAPPRRAPPPSSGFAVSGRRRGGAGGAPGTIRGGDLSKSVAKAPRTGIGREKKRGISTILLRHPGAIRAFATDLDNPRRRGPLGGRPRAEQQPRRAPRRPGGPLTTGRGPPGRHAPGRTTATRSSRSDGAHGSAARPARTRAPAPPVRPGPPVDAPRDARDRHLIRENVC